MPQSQLDSLELHVAIESRLVGLGEKLDATNHKLDAVHLSLEKDINEVKKAQSEDGKRISKSELRLAQLQGALGVLTLASPFVAVALNNILS